MATTTTTATMPATAHPGRVHFDDACVLIPDPVAQSRMPRLIKKSYSLPLWRKRSNSNPPADIVDAAVGPASTAEERGMVITVSVPSFARSRSQSRSESPQRPLVPCIVHANPAAAPRSHPHVRRPSLPLPPRPDPVTVPLRPCCRECFRTTEDCLQKGRAWEEKFTRGARRLMNSSAEMQAHAHMQRHRRVQDDIPGFGAIVSVDEIDKRHGMSSDGVAAAAAAIADASAMLPQQPSAGDLGLLPSFSRRLQIAEPDADTPIVEEDEDLSDTGFPLPSPRRTPTDSPSASSSHLPRGARDDNVRLLLQAVSDNHALQRALAPEPGLSAFRFDHVHAHDYDQYDDDDGERGPDGRRIMSVYYTPDSSPAIPALEPSLNVSSPNTPVLMTPPAPHPIARLPADPQPIPIPIPAPRARSQSQPYAPSKFFADMNMSISPPSFDADTDDVDLSLPLFDSPTLAPLPPPPPPKDYRPRYSMSGSPDLSELPVLTSAAPSPPGTPGSPGSPGRRRAGRHMMRAGSFLRAGAEMLKGVSSLGSGSGPLPLAV